MRFIETFYRTLNSNAKPKLDNAAGGAFMALTFTEVTVILERLTKTNKAWHITDSEVASNTYDMVMLLKRYRRE